MKAARLERYTLDFNSPFSVGCWFFHAEVVSFVVATYDGGETSPVVHLYLNNVGIALPFITGIELTAAQVGSLFAIGNELLGLT